ncbi:unnamed protein product, partial [Chrysoparadoxa australica]
IEHVKRDKAAQRKAKKESMVSRVASYLNDASSAWAYHDEAPGIKQEALASIASAQQGAEAWSEAVETVKLQVKELEQQGSSQGDTVAAKIADVKHLHGEVQLHEKELEEAKRLLEEEGAHIESLRDEVLRRQQEVGEATARLTRQQEAVAAARQESEALKTRLTEKGAVKDAAIQGALEAEELLEKTQKEESAAEAEVVELQAALASTAETTAAISCQIDEGRSALKQAKAELAVLDSKKGQ